ncbi:MAG: nitroreductase family protein [Alistipes sp.]|jgi:predicted oxidoreductase (fatty acid repression mutant protein)|nr:nitroreductase family protein [Alistipes sp.]
MKRTFLEAIEHRRSCYSLSATNPVSESDIISAIDRIILSTPSAYNSQSTRLVVLFGRHHTQLWEIVKNALEEFVSPEAFTGVKEKIDSSFAAGCGTVLFYEDMAVIEQLKEKYTTYADKFDEYSEHTSAMHQFAVWTALEDMELGASLQHYNPLIDTAVAHQWNISKEWRLIAQMPFGTPLSVTETKAQHLPLTIRRLVFSK